MKTKRLRIPHIPPGRWRCPATALRTGSVRKKGQRLIGAAASAVRGGEWWDHKLVPLLAVFYGTALHAGVPASSLWPTVLVYLAALLPGAAYVSISNDIFDLESDAAAGKPNRMARRSRALRAAATAA